MASIHRGLVCILESISIVSLEIVNFDTSVLNWNFVRQPEVAARKLGINSSFIKGDYCYVLVRVSRFRETARLAKPIPPNQMLHEDVSAKIQDMQPGNSTETIQFMTTFGTHYINSYVTGNSLYQVRWSDFDLEFHIAISLCSQFKCHKCFINTWNSFTGFCVFEAKLPTHQRALEDARCGGII